VSLPKRSRSVRAGASAGADDRWPRPPEGELRRRLTALQFAVTQRAGTEPPFDNEFWDNHAEGLYVDVVTGQPLFSSRDKYDSGTGWPSFTRPVEPDAVTEQSDWSMLVRRTEALSRGGTHLGHIFRDGPRPTGLRYCMNSASLRFIPKDDLAREGYGEYARLFEDDAADRPAAG